MALARYKAKAILLTEILTVVSRKTIMALTFPYFPLANKIRKCTAPAKLQYKTFVPSKISKSSLPAFAGVLSGNCTGF